MLQIFNSPLIISLAMNNSCGLRCSFCREGSGNRSLSNKALFKFLDFIKGRNSLTSVVLSGGEPLLDPRLNMILEACRLKDIQISVDTNGNWTLRDVPRLITQFNQIRVKLFSLAEKKHDALAGVKGHGERTYEIIDWISKNIKTSKVLLIPIVSSNLEEMDEIANYAIENGFYCNFFPYPKEFSPDAALSKEEYFLAATMAGLIAKRYSEKIFLDFPSAGLINESLVNLCPAVYISSHIDVDGGFRLCKYASTSMGSLEVSSIQDLWKAQQEVVQKKNKGCVRCDSYKICGGGCMASKEKDGTNYYCFNKVIR